MQIKATQKNTRQTSLKVRLVANQVKKLPLAQAIRQLAVLERRSSLVIMKVIKQAIANAMNNHRLPFEELELENILVTPGPTFKRWRAVSRGRAHNIFKRTCHVQVVLKTKKKPLSASAKPKDVIQPKAVIKKPQSKKALQKAAEKTTKKVTKVTRTKKKK